jgi:hypothetical protein
MAEAAKARAELAALTKGIESNSASIQAAARKNLEAQQDLAKGIKTDADAMNLASSAGQRYNKQVLFAGRDNSTQYMSDLAKETGLLTLLNRAKQRGYMTPLMDYSQKQREYAQLLLWNKASQQGYTSPDQYLNYLQKQRTEFTAMTSAWRDRGHRRLHGHGDRLHQPGRRHPPHCAAAGQHQQGCPGSVLHPGRHS